MRWDAKAMPAAAPLMVRRISRAVRRWVPVCAAASLLWGAGPAYPAQPDAAARDADVPAGAEAGATFARALAAFNAGEYQTALRLFHLARNEGDRRARILYNIALCHYHLRQYDRAQQFFKQIAEDEQIGDLALYSLGLMQRELARPAQAQQTFQLVVETSPDDNLADLATLQLVEMSLPAQQSAGQLAQQSAQRGKSARKVFSGLLELSLIQSDNLLIDRIDPQTSQSASVIGEGEGTQLVAYGKSTDYGGFSGAATVYSTRYDANRNDVRLLNVSGLYWLPFGRHWYEAALSVDQWDLELPYLTVTAWRNRMSFRLARPSRLNFILVARQAEERHSNYLHLAGDISALTMRYLYSADRFRAKVQLRRQQERKGEIEIAFTDVPTDPTLLYTYDNDYTDLSAELEFDLLAKLELTLGWQRRTIDYPRPYRIAVDFLAVEQPSLLRADERTSANMAFRYTVSPKWQAYVRYQALESDSSIDTYDYDSTEITLGFSYGYSF